MDELVNTFPFHETAYKLNLIADLEIAFYIPG
jgi:hypothetical protein